MARAKMAVVHKLSGEIVAIGPTTASVGDMELEGIPISGDDEALIVTEVDDDNVLDLLRTHVVVGQELRPREYGSADAWRREGQPGCTVLCTLESCRMPVGSGTHIVYDMLWW
jgi:hypothetical protein